MLSHLSSFDLFMWQHQNVPPQNKREIERHLQSCPACAEYVATHVSFVQDHKPSPSPPSPSFPKDEKDCLPLDQLGMFVLNELREPERKHVEKHCALCEPCREQLAEVFRAIALPLREGEQAYLANNPPLSLETHLRQILDLSEEQPNGIWENIKNKIPLWLPQPIFKPALVFAVFFLLFAFGKWWAWPEYNYRSLVQESEDRMSLDYQVYYLGDVRPSGDYHSTDVKQTMSVEEPTPSTKNIDELLRSALAYKKDGVEARQTLAQFYLMQGNYSQADSLLRLLEAASPQNAAVRNDRGLWHYAQGQYQAAALAFEQAYAWDMHLESALYNLAITQKQLGQVEAARATWEKYLKLDVAVEWRNAAAAQLHQLENPE